MKNYLFSCITLFTAVLLTGTSLAQSPWTKNKGEGYFQLNYTTISNYNALFLDGDKSWQLSREVNDNTIGLYGEFGITDDITAIGEIPLKLLKTGEERLTNSSVDTPTNSAGSFNTLGNIKLGLKKQIYNKDLNLSGQLTVELPTGGYDEATGLRAGLDALSVIPSVSIGKGFAKYYAFLSLGAGIKTNDHSSDLRVGAEVGANLLKKLWLILVLDIVESFENKSAGFPLRNFETGLYLNNQEYFAYGLKFIVEATEKFGINGGFYGASSGNFVARQASLNLGIYYKLNK